MNNCADTVVKAFHEAVAVRIFSDEEALGSVESRAEFIGAGFAWLE
jgi:hypothetical protein